MKTTTLIFLFLASIFNLSAQSDWYTQIDMNPSIGTESIYNYPTSVIYDNSGVMWTSFAEGGVAKYTNGTYTIYRPSESNFPTDYVRDMCKDNNYIYAASDLGVIKYDGSNWSVYLDSDNGLHSTDAYGIAYDSDKLYIRTDSTLNIYDIQAGTFSYVDLGGVADNWLSSYRRKAVTVFGNSVYVGDTSVVYEINNGSVINTFHVGNVYHNYVNDIQFTSSGQMFICNYSREYLMVNNEFVDVVDYYNFFSGEYLGLMSSNNILIDNDTIYVSGYSFFKFYGTEHNKFEPYQESTDSSSMYNNVYKRLYNGFVFKDNLGNICLHNDNYFYKIFDFTNYRNIHDFTFDSYKFLDINNVNAGFGQSDIMFWGSGTDGNAKYEVPKGSGKHSMFAGGLWIGGYDDNGELHTAATRYQGGYDYFPGPLNNNAETDTVTSYSYNNVWKINRLDIEEVQYRYQHGMLNQVGYEIPDDILSWPANGNTSLGYAQNIAPYYDANGDNVYNIFDGDYPIIKGDQQIFSLFNDNLAEHSETKGMALGIEIQTSFYAYYTCADTTDSTSAINNTTFLHYKITNKSDTTYNNVYVAYYADSDIGDATDDLVGSSVEQNSFYFYNADAMDGDGTGRTYGLNPPAQSITYLKGISADNADGLDNNNNGQTDEVNETCDFNHFVYFNNDQANNSDPDSQIEYYNYMKSIWRDNTHMKFGGDGYSTATDTIAEYMFPGESDPNNYGTHGINPGFIWTGANSDIPDDKRGLASMGPFTLDAGEEIEFELALVWSRDTVNMSVDKLFNDIENVKYWYDLNINLSCLELDTATIGISELPKDNSLKIYPNPVKNKLFVDYTNDNAKCKITDINGKVIFEKYLNRNITEINTSKYAKGVYVITISDSNKTISRKFVK